MCNKVKICQILDNGLRWPLAHTLQDPYLSGVKAWPEKLVYMLCCLFASLARLQNDTLKHGFLNYCNSNIALWFFSYLLNGKSYRNDIYVKMILDSCRIHWQQNNNLAPWWHQPHLHVLGHIWLTCTKYDFSAGLLWWISLVHRRGLSTAKNISKRGKKKWKLKYRIVASTFKAWHFQANLSMTM